MDKGELRMQDLVKGKVHAQGVSSETLKRGAVMNNVGLSFQTT